jgi:hypothetical protein
MLELSTSMPRKNSTTTSMTETDEEIEMEPAPMVLPNLIMVPDDEEDPEEMIPEEDEPYE